MCVKAPECSGPYLYWQPIEDLMKSSHALLAAVSALCLALAACQTSTPDQPRVAGAHAGGYSERRLGADHWRVRFAGDTATPRETVEAYLLYRAAALTAEQGADGFESLANRAERRTHVSVEPDPNRDDAFAHNYGAGWRAEWRYHRRPGGRRTVDPSADARQVMAELGPYIVRPPG
jgi:hypothetical protein